HLLSISHHYTAIFGYAILMKSRLSQPPLPQPEVAFACQQAVAKDASKERHTKIERLDKMPVVRHQDRFDVLRVIQNPDRNVKKTETHNIPELTACTHQEAERVLDVLRQISPYQMAFWTVRTDRTRHIQCSLKAACSKYYRKGPINVEPPGQRTSAAFRLVIAVFSETNQNLNACDKLAGRLLVALPLWCRNYQFLMYS